MATTSSHIPKFQNQNQIKGADADVKDAGEGDGAAEEETVGIGESTRTMDSSEFIAMLRYESACPASISPVECLVFLLERCSFRLWNCSVSSLLSLVRSSFCLCPVREHKQNCEHIERALFTAMTFPNSAFSIRVQAATHRASAGSYPWSSPGYRRRCHDLFQRGKQGLGRG